MRAEQSGQSCRILLVYGTDAQGGIVPMERDLAMKTIAVLSSSLRATDSIGWYRDAYIVGALLTTLQSDSAVEGCSNPKTRVADRLRGTLALTDDHPLQIRVLEPGELTALNTPDLHASFLGSKDTRL